MCHGVGTGLRTCVAQQHPSALHRVSVLHTKSKSNLAALGLTSSPINELAAMRLLERQCCLQVDTTTTGKTNGTVLAGVGFLTSYTAIGEADLKCRHDPIPWALDIAWHLSVFLSDIVPLRRLSDHVSGFTRQHAVWLSIVCRLDPSLYLYIADRAASAKASSCTATSTTGLRRPTGFAAASTNCHAHRYVIHHRAMVVSAPAANSLH